MTLENSEHCVACSYATNIRSCDATLETLYKEGENFRRMITRILEICGIPSPFKGVSCTEMSRESV